MARCGTKVMKTRRPALVESIIWSASSGERPAAHGVIAAGTRGRVQSHRVSLKSFMICSGQQLFQPPRQRSAFYGTNTRSNCAACDRTVNPPVPASDTQTSPGANSSSPAPARGLPGKSSVRCGPNLPNPVRREPKPIPSENTGTRRVAADLHPTRQERSAPDGGPDSLPAKTDRDATRAAARNHKAGK